MNESDTNLDPSRIARLHDAADKMEIIDLSSNYMRGLDRLDGELERTVFWDDAYCSYGTYEGGPNEFVDFCQNALKSHLANHHFLGQINIELNGEEAFGEVYYQAFHRTKDANLNQRCVRTQSSIRAQDKHTSGDSHKNERAQRKGGGWSGGDGVSLSDVNENKHQKQAELDYATYQLY